MQLPLATCGERSKFERSTRFAMGQPRSPSQAAATTRVATQLPIRLPGARAIPVNRSTESASTRPTAGILGTTFSVATGIAIAEPRHAVRAPSEVISDTPSTGRTSPSDSASWLSAR